jgi:hypothetical protein
MLQTQPPPTPTSRLNNLINKTAPDRLSLIVVGKGGMYTPSAGGMCDVDAPEEPERCHGH